MPYPDEHLYRTKCQKYHSMFIDKENKFIDLLFLDFNSINECLVS